MIKPIARAGDIERPSWSSNIVHRGLPSASPVKTKEPRTPGILPAAEVVLRIFADVR